MKQKITVWFNPLQDQLLEALKEQKENKGCGMIATCEMGIQMFHLKDDDVLTYECFKTIKDIRESGWYYIGEL